MPVAIKDDIDVVGEVTAWGTDAYGPPKRADSEVVTRLRSAVAAATGMCGIGLGSDGGGSIRYPSALTGLFGLKPQRNRVPLGPDHHDAWNGLTVYGPLARTVRDAALFLDATGDDVPDGGFSSALDAPMEPLRIAVSFKPPRGSFARLASERRASIEQTAELLRELGHDVFEQEVDYGVQAMWSSTVRYVKGVQQDVASMTRPEPLASNTRRLAAVGARLPNRWLASARRNERAVAARMNKSFEKADLVLTPIAGSQPPKITAVPGRGLTRSLYHSNVAAWAVPWNVIGQPAASVPAGFDSQGLPLALQLCGRPGDEATLLRVAAQLEDARPWAHYLPPLNDA